MSLQSFLLRTFFYLYAILLQEIGLGSEALPLTVAVGSPASALVLYLYTKSIKSLGSRMTLRFSNLACLIMFIAMGVYCGQLKGLSGKVIVVVFYALREIYVSLLSSQQWAFISTTLDKSTSSYLVSFSGIVSVASAVGSCTVERLVTIGGVRGLLFTSLAATVIGLIAAESANVIVVHHHQQRARRDAERKAAGLSPYQTPKPSSDNLASLDTSTQRSDSSKTMKSDTTASEAKPTGVATAAKHSPKAGFWRDSWDLIRSYPILQLLFFEAITHQVCTNMLNIMFHNSLRFSPMDSALKAKLVGRFFATVSIVSCGLQCFVLPTILSQSTLPRVLMYLPFIVFATVMIGVVHPGLVSVMLGFGTMKVLEYSIMHSASEMIYVPLGHEVRYVGKELVKFFGHKLGKSAASLVLSFLIAKLQPSIMFQSIWGGAFSLIWAVSIFGLSKHLVERANEDDDDDDTDADGNGYRDGSNNNNDATNNLDDVALYGDKSAVVTSEPLKMQSSRHSEAPYDRTRSSLRKRDMRLTTSTSMPIFEIPASTSTGSMASWQLQSRSSRCTTEDETTLSEAEMAPFWMSDSDDNDDDHHDRVAAGGKAPSSKEKLSTYLAELRLRRLTKAASSAKDLSSHVPEQRTLSPFSSEKNIRSSSLTAPSGDAATGSGDALPSGQSTPSSMSSWFSRTSMESSLSVDELVNGGIDMDRDSHVGDFIGDTLTSMLVGLPLESASDDSADEPDYDPAAVVVERRRRVASHAAGDETPSSSSVVELSPAFPSSSATDVVDPIVKKKQ